MPADAIINALRARGGFEAVRSDVDDSQAHLTGRVTPNMTSHWLLLSHSLLKASQQQDCGWDVDISRVYFLKELPSGTKMFYAWRVIFQAKDIETQVDSICQAISSAPAPQMAELEEFPLVGARDRHAKKSSGGYAGPMGAVPVGPLARQQR